MRYFKNTIDNYGWGAIFLHWIMAILILGQIYLGWYMNQLEFSPTMLKLFGWHKQIGILIFLLALVRLSWRSMNVLPSLSALPLWEQLASRGVHRIMYFFMLAIPISGWLMSSAKGVSVSFFGLFVLPDLLSPDKPLGHFLKEVHVWLAFTFLAFIGLHVAAALKHHFIDKDNILRRML